MFLGMAAVWSSCKRDVFDIIKNCVKVCVCMWVIQPKVSQRYTRRLAASKKGPPKDDTFGFEIPLAYDTFGSDTFGL